MSRHRTIFLSTVSAAAFVCSVPASAQQASPPPPSDVPNQTPPACPVNGPGSNQDNCISGEIETEAGVAVPPDKGEIVVTGTRIQRPNLQSPVPITSVGQDELTNQGQASVGDALNDLPALRSTFSQQNSGRFIGTAGQNFLDLRGLGTSRTLVLVNGRRHVTASPGSFDVDVDDIPQDLVERVDVVTGGESAVYGSDAIAGVVNFILKKNFDGLRLRAQSGISKYGDRPVDFISGTFGHNFADGRGNVAVNLEYTHAGELFYRDRANFRQVCGFEPNQDTTGEPQAGDGIPDNIFVCGIRNPFITEGGQIGLLSYDGTGLAFANNGDLVVSSTPSRSFIGFGGTVISNDPLVGSTLRETGDLAVGRDRYMANLLGHFDVSDAFKPFIEASYIHQNVQQEGQPSFFQGRLSNFFGPIVPSLRCSNPFLSAQALGTLQSYGICRNVATGTLGLNRFNTDFGPRIETDKRDTYRIVAGIEGDFYGDWHYEVSANYGHFKSDNIERNDLLISDQNGNPAGFSLAVDAVRDSSGNIVCRVNADSDPTNDAPGCVPIDLFGFGAPSQAALNYVDTTSHLYSTASETDIVGFISGNSGHWFALQGGPVGFSLGAEYRRETAHQVADAVSAAGGTFFNAFPEFDPPSFAVKEAFGELEVPFLRNKPFAEELSLSGAARYSDYNTSAGHTFAWNINGIYSPVRDLRLRANISRSVRVPTLGDLYSPPTVNFAFLDDPCDQRAIGNNANRAANCAALGVPTTVLAGSPCAGTNAPVGSPFHNCVADTQNIQITSAGNPNLQAEVGNSFTFGGVLTPRYIPGFSLSVDYFNIRVENLIATLGGNTILAQCVDQSSINNQYCALLGPRDQYGLFPTPALTSAGVNYAKQTSRGIDFDTSYRRHFANGLRLDVRGIATYTLARYNYINPVDPTYASRQLSVLGDPVFSGTLITGLGMGKFDLRYTFRYIGTQDVFAYDTTHSVQGRPPQNPDVADRFRTGSVTYSDLRLGFTVPRYQFYLGVDNLFNRMPPLGLTGAGSGSGIYSSIGRFYYAGVILDFK